MQRHLTRCPSCRRYESVVEHGASVLRSLPEPQLREDFEPRLQHRLYHVADERGAGEQPGSGTPALTVVGVAVLLTIVAWAPVLRGGVGVVELDPIVVDRAPIARQARPLPPPRPRSAGDEPVRQLDNDLWDDTRLWEYSPLRRRYEAAARSRQVDLEPGR